METSTSLAAWLAGGVPRTTARAYRSAFRRYQAAGGPFPASPVDIVTYVKALSEDGYAFGTITVALGALARAHRLMGEPDPTTHELVDLARDAARSAAPPSVGKADCPPERLAEWLAVARSQTSQLRATRDAAMIALMWWGALRRAEVVTLRLPDVVASDAGLILHVIRKGSKPCLVGIAPCDDEPSLCALRAWHAWFPFLPTDDGPVFRRVYPSGTVGAEGLTEETVRNVVKNVSGRDAKSGAHSLRVGVATHMFRMNKPLAAIMEHCGWESAQTALGYFRRGRILADDAVTRGILKSRG